MLLVCIPAGKNNTVAKGLTPSLLLFWHHDKKIRIIWIHWEHKDMTCSPAVANSRDSTSCTWRRVRTKLSWSHVSEVREKWLYVHCKSPRWTQCAWLQVWCDHVYSQEFESSKCQWTGSKCLSSWCQEALNIHWYLHSLCPLKTQSHCAWIVCLNGTQRKKRILYLASH